MLDVFPIDEHGRVRSLVAFHTVFQVLNERSGLLGLAEILRAQGQQSAGAGIELFAMIPKVFKRLGLECRGLAGFGAVNMRGQCVQHPRLHVGILFLFNQALVQKRHRAPDRIVAAPH